IASWRSAPLHPRLLSGRAFRAEDHRFVILTHQTRPSDVHAFGLSNRTITFEDRFLFLEADYRSHRGAPEVKCENTQKIQHNEQRVMRKKRREMADSHPALRFPPQKLDFLAG